MFNPQEGEIPPKQEDPIIGEVKQRLKNLAGVIFSEAPRGVDGSRRKIFPPWKKVPTVSWKEGGVSFYAETSRTNEGDGCRLLKADFTEEQNGQIEVQLDERGNIVTISMAGLNFIDANFRLYPIPTGTDFCSFSFKRLSSGKIGFESRGVYLIAGSGWTTEQEKLYGISDIGSNLNSILERIEKKLLPPAKPQEH